MTKEEIIKLAKQAGLDPDLWNYTDAFERFAKLVAAKEREACANICEEKYYLAVADAIRARGQE
jgi:hypothetical protein